MDLKPFGEGQHKASFSDSSFSSHGENHALGWGGGRDDKKVNRNFSVRLVR